MVYDYMSFWVLQLVSLQISSFEPKGWLTLQGGVSEENNGFNFLVKYE